jgi:ABC-2 type transport system permease protein
MIARIKAFVRRDFADALSYKAAFVYQLGALFSTILTVYFLARMVSEAQLPSLTPYGGDYFTFALIGAAFADYMSVTLHEFSRSIRTAQILGTLEAMLATPSSPAVIVIGSAIYRFIWSLLRVFFYVAGGLFLGASFPHVDVFAALLTMILSMVAFGAVGILGASAVLVLKAWNPVAALFSGLSFLLGGVLYPVSTLPAAGQWLAFLLPITHALEAMRGAVIMGKGVTELAFPLTVLAGFTVIALPLSLWAFKKALHHMRVEGSLSHY